MRKLSCLIIAVNLSMQISFAQDSTSASVDANMAAQKTACDKNTSMTWSTKLNRCIGKQAAVDTRNEVKACDSLTDVAAKQNCQMKIAEKNSGLSSDTGSLYKGNTTGSAVMNGAATIIGAYTATSIFHDKASSGANSNCMSKKIYGVTGLAGLASDVYLKMKAKKKVKELEGKYMLDTKSTAYEAQIKALEYLKEEQNTVVSIAGMEKKRNMLLMVGYGLATAWAIYEITPYGQNPDCVPKEKKADDKTADKKPAVEDAKPQAVAPEDKLAKFKADALKDTTLPPSAVEGIKAAPASTITNGVQSQGVNMETGAITLPVK